jgi:hypothetical protein
VRRGCGKGQKAESRNLESRKAKGVEPGVVKEELARKTVRLINMVKKHPMISNKWRIVLVN